MPTSLLPTLLAAARSFVGPLARLSLTVLLLAGALVLAPQAEAEPATAALDAPLALMESGRYEEAAQSLIQLLPGMDPDAARQARIHLAECYERSGAWEDAARLWHDLAISTLDRAQRSAALFREAASRHEAGQLEEAAGLYVGFHYLRPDSAAQSEALARAADCIADLSRWPVAASYYQLALDHATASDRLGVVYRLSEALLLSGQGNAALAVLLAEGGFKRVVWLSSNIKEQMAEELAEVCKREGDPDLIDKIADERSVTTVEELLAFIEEKGHPALTMDPIF